VVEGTCDELGRVASWILLEPSGPVSLTLAVRLATLSTVEGPALLAERLPKALIHHNVPGTPINGFLTALQRCWQHAAPLAPFGPRQRWARAVRLLGEGGWPILGDVRRARLGEVSVAWSAVADRSC
jgi:hypothetical protein